MHKRYLTRSGFTIVELLIVIVVVAILAAITVVTFNGIQARAKNAQTLASFDAVEKALRLYHAEHGSYPATVDEAGYPLDPNNPYAIHACIGDISSYPKTAFFEAGECYKSSDEGNYAISMNNVNDALNSVAPKLVISTANEIANESSGVRGILYYSNGPHSSLVYLQQGDRDCGRGEKAVDDMLGDEGELIDHVTSCVLVLQGEPQY